MVWGAIRVVTTNNVVHAALWLVVVLGGVAAQYILAAAEFVAVSQILVYIGAVMVLFLFGIMLTRATVGAEDRPQQQGVGASASPWRSACSACSAYAVIDAVGDDVLVDPDAGADRRDHHRHQRRLPRATTSSRSSRCRSSCSPPPSAPSCWRGKTDVRRQLPRAERGACSASACSASSPAATP